MRICVCLNLNSLYKQTNQMHFFVYIYLSYNFLSTLRVSKDHIVHHQEFRGLLYLLISTTAQTCLTSLFVQL
jgi:hypothetical protein